MRDGAAAAAPAWATRAPTGWLTRRLPAVPPAAARARFRYLLRPAWRSTPGQSKFRMLMWNNEVWVTSGGLRRQQFEGLDYFIVTQIEDTAKK